MRNGFNDTMKPYFFKVLVFLVVAILCFSINNFSYSQDTNFGGTFSTGIPFTLSKDPVDRKNIGVDLFFFIDWITTIERAKVSFSFGFGANTLLQDYLSDLNPAIDYKSGKIVFILLRGDYYFELQNQFLFFFLGCRTGFGSTADIGYKGKAYLIGVFSPELGINLEARFDKTILGLSIGVYLNFNLALTSYVLLTPFLEVYFHF